MIYISYSLKDEAPYSSLCLILEHENLPYWNQHSLKSGASLREQLHEAISECSVCIFIATPNSVKSQWCSNEVGAFWGTRKRIIVFAAHAGMENKLPPLFKGDYWTSNARELIRQLREVLGEPETKTSEKGSAAVPTHAEQRGVDYFDRANRSASSYSVLEELKEHIKGLQETAYVPNYNGESAGSILSEVDHLNGQIGGLWRLSQSEAASSMLLKEIQSDLDVLQRKLKADEELKPYKIKLLQLTAGDERLLHTLLEAFGGRNGVIRKSKLKIESVFKDEDGREIGRIEKILADAGYRTELDVDEEHGLWEVETIATGGAKVRVDWELASQAEFQKAVEVYKSL